MGKLIRLCVIGAIVGAVSLGAVATAIDTPLPTEFTSGGVLWGDATSNDGFHNDGYACTSANGEGFNMGDATLLATDQADAFDDAGLVRVDLPYFVVPGGVNGPVDLTGTSLQTPTAPLGGLNVNVQWQGAGSGTVRELVSLTNPGPTDFAHEVVIETDMGSDANTTLEAASTGDISGYPTGARWFATSDGPKKSDPPVLSVATGPGSVQSPATIVDCPKAAATDAGKAPKADAVGDPVASTPNATDDAGAAAPAPPVNATGTLLGTQFFTYHYNVAIPAGQTRYVMVFWSLYPTVDAAVAAGPTWNTNPASGSEALAGISTAQLQQIVNWTFPIEIAPKFTG